MSIDKQIDEMTKIMNETCNVYDEQGNHIRNKCYECECWSDDNHCCCSYNTKEAEALYNAGYRKAADVAEEIFAEIDKEILGSDRGDDLTYGQIMDFIAELKKKYESEKDNADNNR